MMDAVATRAILSPYRAFARCWGPSQTFKLQVLTVNTAAAQIRSHARAQEARECGRREAENGHIHITSRELTGFVPCWAKRCNRGVGGAAALKGNIRCVCSHMKQRDELVFNAEHEVVPRCVLQRAVLVSLAARLGRAFWRCWLRCGCGCCCPPATSSTHAGWA